MEMIIYSPKRKTEFTVIYDDEDHEAISNHKWSIYKQKNRCYAIANPGGSVKMHRLIMGNPPGLEVDHRNHNGLDNRKENLRIATHAQNNQNKKPQKSNKTGFKGVHLYKSRNKYQVYIDVNGKRITGGYFKDIIQAAKKYNEMAVKFHGEFAYLNPIPNE